MHECGMQDEYLASQLVLLALFLNQSLRAWRLPIWELPWLKVLKGDFNS